MHPLIERLARKPRHQTADIHRAVHLAIKVCRLDLARVAGEPVDGRHQKRMKMIRQLLRYGRRCLFPLVKMADA
jgi:hypothetical protein